MDTPLYHSVVLAQEGLRGAESIIDFLVVLTVNPGHLDVYCPGCERDSTFKLDRRSYGPDRPRSYGPMDQRNSQERLSEFIDRPINVEFRCVRNPTHRLLFCLLVSDINEIGEPRQITKIGQFPSQRDLASGAIKRYRRRLDRLGPTMAKEYATALGLHAHGVGIGSFVYLRRIFETLVEEAHKTAMAKPAWDEDSYAKARMSEKIDLLRGILPGTLVQNRKVYGILSKGLHELGEEECLRYFQIVDCGIRVFLDEAIRRKEETDRAAEFSVAMSNLPSS
ncbi:MAG: hypothetical protein HY000_20995 [Planctomycetes bacterium]|nr:hypothetical protein [Planctomycetota bacterium]